MALFYEGGLEGYHFVVKLDSPHVATFLGNLRRGPERFKNQCRQAVVDGAVALSRWRSCGPHGGRLVEYNETCDFDEVTNRRYVVRVGTNPRWHTPKFKLFCEIDQVIHPVVVPQRGRRPPQQIVVRIVVDDILVLPQEHLVQARDGSGGTGGEEDDDGVAWGDL